MVDALQARFTSSPASPGLELTVAGEELSSAPPLQENQQVLAKLLGFETVSTKRLVQRSSFSFAPHDGKLSLVGEDNLQSTGHTIHHL